METPSASPRTAADLDPWGLEIRTSREEYVPDPSRSTTREIVTLRQLLDKYSVTLGYHNAHLLEVLVVLLTTGKVRVEFRSFMERLELCEKSWIMTRPATVELFNDYLVGRKEKKVTSGPQATQHITVQLPRISASTGSLPRRAPPVP